LADRSRYDALVGQIILYTGVTPTPAQLNNFYTNQVAGMTNLEWDRFVERVLAMDTTKVVAAITASKAFLGFP
jgi:hypothetical protein